MWKWFRINFMCDAGWHKPIGKPEKNSIGLLICKYCNHTYGYWCHYDKQ